MFYLDESGFSPPLPTGYSWSLPISGSWSGTSNPQGRRVNALATFGPFAPAPGLGAVPFERMLASDDRLAFLRDRLPAAEVPRVVVLNNAGIHTSEVVKAARPGLARLAISLYDLPPYSPELNRTGPVFEQAKHHDMPTRHFTGRADLREAVEVGFAAYRTPPAGKSDYEPRLLTVGSGMSDCPVRPY